MMEQYIYGEQLKLWKEERLSWNSFSPETRQEVRRLIGQLLLSELLKNRKENYDEDK